MPNIRRSMMHTDSVATNAIEDKAVTNAKLAATAVNPDVVSPTAASGWGVPVSFSTDITDAAGDTNFTLPFKFELQEVQIIKTVGNGGAGDTITVKAGGTAITNAISLNLTNKATAWEGAIDVAQSTMAKGSTLRFTTAKVTNCACRVTVAGTIRS